jgi:hypothetical protein
MNITQSEKTVGGVKETRSIEGKNRDAVTFSVELS